MSDGLQEARALIKQAIAEIDQERNQLQSVLSAFGATARSSADLPARKPHQRIIRRRRARRGKRAARGQRAEQFLAAIDEKPGATVTEIAKKLGVERTSLYPVAKKLRAEKRISKRGSGFAVRP
jgi:transcriptional regulator of acetoin/glycerol metabolism